MSIQSGSNKTNMTTRRLVKLKKPNVSSVIKNFLFRFNFFVKFAPQYNLIEHART